jgi:hypothetical protein
MTVSRPSCAQGALGRSWVLMGAAEYCRVQLSVVGAAWRIWALLGPALIQMWRTSRHGAHLALDGSNFEVLMNPKSTFHNHMVESWKRLTKHSVEQADIWNKRNAKITFSRALMLHILNTAASFGRHSMRSPNTPYFESQTFKIVTGRTLNIMYSICFQLASRPLF